MSSNFATMRTISDLRRVIQDEQEDSFLLSGAQCLRCLHIHREVIAHHDLVDLARAGPADVAVADVFNDQRGIALGRVAEPAASTSLKMSSPTSAVAICREKTSPPCNRAKNALYERCSQGIACPRSGGLAASSS